MFYSGALGLPGGQPITTEIMSGTLTEAQRGEGGDVRDDSCQHKAFVGVCVWIRESVRVCLCVCLCACVFVRVFANCAPECVKPLV